jgi:hypothetical protein
MLRWVGIEMAIQEVLVASGEDVGGSRGNFEAFGTGVSSIPLMSCGDTKGGLK